MLGVTACSTDVLDFFRWAITWPVTAPAGMTSVAPSAFMVPPREFDTLRLRILGDVFGAAALVLAEVHPASSAATTRPTRRVQDQRVRPRVRTT